MISELATAVVLIGILCLFLNPMGLLMPESTVMLLLIGLILTYFIFLGFIWKEYHGDEREYVHRLHAGRISFFTGSMILIIGIILQSLKHDIDPWLIAGLGTMILTKIIVRLYSQITY